jgi:acyl-CoA dehydrogenase
LFAIPINKEAEGLSMRRIVKMGGRGVDANEVFFDNYVVDEDTLVGGAGSSGKGFKMILHGMNAERCLIAAEALGLGYAA